MEQNFLFLQNDRRFAKYVILTPQRRVNIDSLSIQFLTQHCVRCKGNISRRVYVIGLKAMKYGKINQLT